MSGGGNKQPQTTIQSSEPPVYLQPYLKEAAGEAQNLYRSGGASYYPGSTVVPLSSETQKGLSTITNLALQGGQLTPAATETVLSTIRGTGGVNPFLADAVRSAQAPVYEQFNKETLPALQSIFERTSGGAGTGGSAEGQAAELATSKFGRALGEISGNLAYQAASQERQNQLNAAQLAPTLDAARFADAQALMGAGGVIEGQKAAELQADIDRYNYNQNLPALRLNQYLQQLGMSGSGSSVTQQVYGGQNRGSPALGALGGAATGAAIGSVIPGVGTAIGAGVGGLAGLGGSQGWF